MTIFLTGASGFVGTAIQKYFPHKYKFYNYVRNSKILINEDVVLHFAGKAHDLINFLEPNIYFEVNTELSKKVYDAFLDSKAKVFIILSSVKAIADFVQNELTEEELPHPITDYGKSKLLAEQYIIKKPFPKDKRVYILRPCMIHGPGNKGNLNLLYKFVKNGIPWLLGSFDNKRSFCSIDNLCFIINELIENDKIQSGVYNVADDESISTNELIGLIAESQRKNVNILKIPRFIIISLLKFGDLFKLPLNSERLNKLTENYIVSNKKIKLAIKKPLPISTKEGLMKTLNSFGKSNIN
jgi:nucleoside-diphosphate-sugar epimerase